MERLPDVRRLRHAYTREQLEFGSMEKEIIVLNSVLSELRAMSREAQVGLHVSFLEKCRVMARECNQNFRNVPFERRRRLNAGKLDLINLVNDKSLVALHREEFLGIRFDSAKYCFLAVAARSNYAKASSYGPDSVIRNEELIESMIRLAKEGWFVV